MRLRFWLPFIAGTAALLAFVGWIGVRVADFDLPRF